MALIILSITSNVFCQDEYRWINIPYSSNDMSDHPYIQGYLNLNDSVKSLNQYKANFSLTATGRDLIIAYNRKGNITSVQHFISDNFDDELSSSNLHEFQYNSEGFIASETHIYIDKGDTISSIVINDYWINNISPKPVMVNEIGRSTVFTAQGDTTYSFYDTYGRKTLDSIPDSGHTMCHKNKYSYFKDSIAVHTEFLSGDDSNYLTSYKLDRHGNWIEKTVTYKNEALFPVYAWRQILYYE
jgi:hypothetical protein